MLRAAHDANLRVVAWYLPHFNDVNADFRRERALLNFKANGQQFDGLAVDIEWNRGVPDPTERNAALVDLSKRVRKLAGDRPVGAIVLEPLFLDVVSPDYWPEFPWRQLSSLYDVWLPTLYWTNRSADSGYKEGFKYTDENIRQVRSNLGDKSAPVHAIGAGGDRQGELPGLQGSRRGRHQARRPAGGLTVAVRPEHVHPHVRPEN